MPIRLRNGRVARALGKCLLDWSQPPEVLAEAAESLKYNESKAGVPALLQATIHPDVRVRFFAVFALGGQDWPTPEILQALAARVDDKEQAPGYWSVGQEAIAVLGRAYWRIPPLMDLARAEFDRVRADAGATESDKRWVKFYGR